MRYRHDLWRAVGAIFLGAASGCSYNDPDPMQKQDKYQSFRPSAFFEDGMAMRPVVSGTVPTEHLGRPATPAAPDAAPIENGPRTVTRELLETGRTHFERYCAICHGVLGDADSMVGARMPLRHPPSLIQWPPFASEHVHRVVMEGFGLMPSYADVFDTDAAWSITAYVQVLARSQHVAAATLPPAVRRTLEEAP